MTQITMTWAACVETTRSRPRIRLDSGADGHRGAGREQRAWKRLAVMHLSASRAINEAARSLRVNPTPSTQCKPRINLVLTISRNSRS